ncbi:hypothetical protein U9M48_025115 [Paspalum notatum var. saurae]|uniref:Uncharacterized protein n=1 Tax=Paspalum notatum var. saurae TaxID=547442 RepID=A0AAQ3TSW2_PASNO
MVSASASATPSPAAAQLVQHWASAAGGSPADGGAQVDRRADEFIRRFYEQLRAQRSAASTPDYYGAGAATTSASRAPWPVTAGIA